MEIWKPLRLNPEFQVSSYGNVRRNLNRNLEYINNAGLCGYLKKYNRPYRTNHSSRNKTIMNICSVGDSLVSARLDRVIYTHFISEFDSRKYDIFHKDGNRSNCHYENLALKPKNSYLNRAYGVYKKAIKRAIKNSDHSRCSVCDNYKHVSHFNWHKTLNRYMSMCKKCQNKNLYKRFKERRESDPVFKLGMNVRSRTTLAIKSMGYTKKSKTADMLGCSWGYLKGHLEKMFTDEMTWDNYGDWHVDHIIPLSMASNEEQIYKLAHYTNLQPLWANENISKNNRLPKDQIDKAISMGLKIDYDNII